MVSAQNTSCLQNFSTLSHVSYLLEFKQRVYPSYVWNRIRFCRSPLSESKYGNLFWRKHDFVSVFAKCLRTVRGSLFQSSQSYACMVCYFYSKKSTWAWIVHLLQFAAKIEDPTFSTIQYCNFLALRGRTPSGRLRVSVPSSKKSEYNCVEPHVSEVRKYIRKQ